MLTFIRSTLFAFALLNVASAAETDGAATLKDTLTHAVKERRVVTFVYQGQARTVEPHACGITVTSGEAVLHGYQTEGGSASGIPPGWRTFSIAKIGEFVVTDKTFGVARQGYTTGRPHLDPLWAEVAVAAP